MSRIEIFVPPYLRKKIYETTYGSLQNTEYGYGLDHWFFALRDHPQLSEGDILPKSEVSCRVDQLLSSGYRLAYWSGGFDLGFHHANELCLIRESVPADVLMVMGIESDYYIRAKGREPVFNQMFRLSAVATLLKQEGKLGVAFPIPVRPIDTDVRDFYDELVNDVGMYRRENCFHIYSDNDPNIEVKRKRMIESAGWSMIRAWRSRDNEPISTSKLLKTRVKR